jgi:hypothetical protein
MPSYSWLDTNVLIEAYQGPYSFDIAPGFWKAIERAAKDNKVRSPIRVQGELVGDDDLVKWAKGPGSHLFTQSGQPEQKAVATISTYVLNTYPKFKADKFLAGADPWVIAHALVNQGTCVTQEVLVASNSQAVKIPNVCQYLKVPWLNTYNLLRQLGVKLK